jgi:hypothetical protein
MIRLLRVLIAAGSVVTFAACSEMGPTAPRSALAVGAAGDLVVFSAPAPSASCTVTPNGAMYDVTVSWSGFSVSTIDLWQTGGSQPLAQTILVHPRRKGSIPYSLTAAPDYAQVAGRDVGLKAVCVTGP